MVDSPCRTHNPGEVRWPADEAMSTLVDFAETFDPLADVVPQRQIKEVEPVRRIIAAGFTDTQVADALRVEAADVQSWIEPGQVWVLLDRSRVKALDWLLKIAQTRLAAGYLPDTTRSWWQSSLQKLGWKQPCSVFHHNPRRVRDSIKPKVATRRLRTEPPGAKRAGWENIPGILGA